MFPVDFYEVPSLDKHTRDRSCELRGSDERGSVLRPWELLQSRMSSCQLSEPTLAKASSGFVPVFQHLESNS